jgi:NADH/F420H2 dehydrogenase subunit C
MTPEQLASRIVVDFPELGITAHVDKEHAVAELAAEKLPVFVQGLKEQPDYDFSVLMDMTAVDWFERRSTRFDVVYHLFSHEHNHRLRIKLQVADGQHVPSLTRFWPIADWFEREVWDLYGIKFDGHPNLKRILMYEEFKGHPLRKDYPYDKRQPLIEESWPVRNVQVRMKEAEKIHRP